MATLLHNMSVPPRSQLTVERLAVAGRRYSVDLPRVLRLARDCTDSALTMLFRSHGIGAARALVRDDALGGSLADLTSRAAFLASHTDDAEQRLKRECEQAVATLGLPPGIGFFIEGDSATRRRFATPAQAIALLSARSGPLYLPGRFEPSLVTVAAVTLFFPVPEAD